MIICGIDPGNKGGVSFIDTSPFRLVATYDMPMEEKTVPSQKSGHTKVSELSGVGFKDLLLRHQPSVVYIEHILPSYGAKGGVKQGSVSNAKFYGDFRYLQGIILALNFPSVAVYPQVWKRKLGLIGEDKSESVRLAMNLFADHKEEFYRGNKKDKSKIVLLDGRAESALIAYYGLKDRE